MASFYLGNEKFTCFSSFGHGDEMYLHFSTDAPYIMSPTCLNRIEIDSRTVAMQSAHLRRTYLVFT